MAKLLFVLLLPALFVMPGAAQTPSSSLRDLIAPRYADTILYNGAVLTVDDKDTVAEAVAVRDGRILAVGASSAVLELAGPKTVKVDLERKKTVMPGIVNTHSHPQRYVASHYWNYIPRQYQELIRADVIAEEITTKEQLLARIKTIVDKSTHPSREWVRVNWLVLEEEQQDKNEAYVEPEGDKLFLSLTKEDLDTVSPNKPLVMRRQIFDPQKDSNWAIMNSKGFARFLASYANMLNLDPKTHSGHVSGYLYEMLYDEVLPHLPREVLHPLYKRELAEWFAPIGVTTVNTRLKAFHIAAFSELDRRGEMPIRVAYGHEIGRYNAFFERDVHRSLGGVDGYGSDTLWMTGISIEQPDISPRSGLCSSFTKLKPKANDPYPEGRCYWDLPGNQGRQTATVLTKLGYRVAGTHTQGDGAYEMMLDTVIAAAGGVEAARTRRIVLEHGTMANPSMIKKAAAIGAIWSTQPGDIPEGRHELVGEIYGKEVADRMFMPTKTMLDAGITVSWESGGTDGFDNPESKRRPFVGMEIMVTRKDKEGVVRAPRERVDRKTALKILTRGGAAYALKEKELGSVEPGKFADLLVLDTNPLDPAIADDDLSKIQVLMTMVGGTVVYDVATFKAPAEDVRTARDGRSFIDNETE
jgi:predicted amidohydrolase YtcJ